MAKVSHKLYRHRTSRKEIRAIRVTARNFINVANWCGGMAISKVSKDGDVTNQRVRVNGLVAQIGDFVVRDQVPSVNKKPAYKFFRVKDDVFEAEYKLAP